jgi:hypothetical protein
MMTMEETLSERSDTIDELKSALGDLLTTVEELIAGPVIAADHDALQRVRVALEEARDAAETLADPQDRAS